MSDSLIPFTKTPSMLTIQSANSQPRVSEPIGFLCFTLDDEEFGVDLQLVCQVVKPPPVTWVPRVSNQFLGVIPIRGQVVTLVDLKQLMGRRPTEWPKGARVLIVETGEEQIGLLVDSVTQVRRFMMKELEKKPNLPGDKSGDHVICVARIEGVKPVLIVDLDAVLQEKMK
jgi:purine-binding chemotaxis protein CheW